MTILRYQKVFLENQTESWIIVDNFYKQMLELKSKQVVYLDDYNPHNSNQIVITFDGVCKNVLEYAAPILHKFNYPFELFISTDYLGQYKEFESLAEPRVEFANLDDLKLLIQKNGRLQWCSKSYVDLSKVQDVSNILIELEVPNFLQYMDTKGFKWFAYPFGNFNLLVLEEVKKRFAGAVSWDRGNDTDIYCLNRVKVTNEMKFKSATTSVIITAYNQGCFLIEAIESVLRQTRIPDAILISDDASDDNTYEIAKFYQKKYPHLIKVNRNEENLGIVKNFNKAVSLTQTDYISILNADDRYRSDFIEKTSIVLDLYPDIGIAYSDFALFGPRAKVVYDSFPVNRRSLIKADKFFVISFPDFDEQSKEELLTKGNFIHGASLFRRQAFDEVGGYVYQPTVPEDYYLFLRMVKHGWNAKRVPFPILEYRQYSKNQTNVRLASFAELQFYKQLTKTLYTELEQLKLQFYNSQTQESQEEADARNTLINSITEHINYPKINNVSPEFDRPLWSVMIPTYNNTEYLEQTLRSVLDQAPEPEVMQIEVVDDCSTTGDVKAIVQRVGKGRVSFYRQPKNLGLIGNWNACIERARGYWVHILHQDDFVMPEFYTKLQVYFHQQPQIGAAFCRHIFIDSQGQQIAISYLERETPGILENWLERIAGECLIQCASIVVKRSCYEQLGGFCSQAGYAADWEMWKRIATHNAFWYEPEILAVYRSHSLSATSGYIRSGANIADTRRAIEISQSYLPENIATEVSNKAREHYARYAFGIAQQMLAIDCVDVAIAQIREGLKCITSPEVMSAFATLVTQSEILLRAFASLLLCTENKQLLNSVSPSYEQKPPLELNLRDINLIVFPDWQQPEELLYEDIVMLIKVLLTHVEKDRITLLIDDSGISNEDVNLIISDVIFNLLQEEDLDVTEELQFSLVGNLTENEWQDILPKIYAKILFKRENKQAILQANAENLYVCHLEGISDIRSVDLDTKLNKLKFECGNKLNIVRSLGDKPRIDLVLPATGLHGWSCSYGWANVLRQEGLLNRVFIPIATWGADEPDYDDSLFEYLKNPQSDIILMQSFNWHSQALHNTFKWQERWQQSPIKKLGIVQECYSSEIVQNTPEWKQQMFHSIITTIPCVDILLCNHEPDVEFLQKQMQISLPIQFMSNAIDPEHSRVKIKFDKRCNRAVFRGNIAQYFTTKTYMDRRQFIQILSQSEEVDLFQFCFDSIKNPLEAVQRYSNELNAYKLNLNLPSMSATLTHRPFEIMACGGVLLQNRVFGEESNKFFQDWEHLVYYDPQNPNDLVKKIQYLVANPELMRRIATQGHQLCYEQHTISNRIASILGWLGYSFEKKTNTAQFVSPL